MDEKDKRLVMLAAILIPIVILVFLELAMAYVSFIVLVIIIIALYATKNANKKEIFLIFLPYFIFFIAYSGFLLPSIDIAKGQGTVLDDAWFEGLNWIRNNTEECSIVATYWDPGHLITGVARRAVIFDGASQSTLRTYVVPGNLSEDEIKDIAATDIYVAKTKFNTTLNEVVTEITTARIKDISTTLFTDNETQAIKILNRYRKDNCTMYYLVSGLTSVSDLIRISGWWSYFSTFDPVNKGTHYNYLVLTLSQMKPIVSENIVSYEYAISASQKFVLYEQNNTLRPYFQAQNQFQPVEKVFFFDNTGTPHLNITKNEAEVKGMLWVFPGKSALIYIPPQLENSLFTKLFLFNGMNLDGTPVKGFEYVNGWPSNSWFKEVRLYKVNFSNLTS